VVGLLMLLAGWAESAPSRVTVLAVKVVNAGETSRVSLDLSRAVDYRLFMLADPPRLVIDLPPAVWTQQPEPVDAEGVVSRYRYGTFNDSTARMVLELSGPARVREARFNPMPRSNGRQLELQIESLTVPRASVAGILPPPPSPPPAPPPVPAQAPAPPPPTAEEKIAAVTAPPPPPPAVTRAAAVAPMPPRARPAQPQRRVVVLDPGHGGQDPGAVGAGGAHEKTITLAMAREIRRQLQATRRYTVHLTRDRDVFLPLRGRYARARAVKADLFVSLHADSMPNPAVRGATIYTLSETASDAEAAALAQRENKSDQIGGLSLRGEQRDVASVLVDIIQRETQNRSAMAAASMVAALGRENLLLPQRPHRSAGFAVLKAPDVPSLLLELGYLSNRQDERQLSDPRHRRRLAAAIVRAIDAHFAAH